MKVKCLPIPGQAVRCARPFLRIALMRYIVRWDLQEAIVCPDYTHVVIGVQCE